MVRLIRSPIILDECAQWVNKRWLEAGKKEFGKFLSLSAQAYVYLVHGIKAREAPAYLLREARSVISKTQRSLRTKKVQLELF